MNRALPLAALLALGLAGCGGDSGDGMGPSPQGVTLLDVQTQVLTPRCAISGCHVGSGAPFGLDMSSVSASSANLIDVASAEMPALMRVHPGDAAGSYLYMKVSGDPSILGDPMPASGGALSDGDIDLIARWIDGGAE